jgi:hypothetical protein
MPPTKNLLAAEPVPVELIWAKTALVIIDMQRDFLEPGGFGETLGNDVSQLARAVKPCGDVLAASRKAGLLVIHTREGHLPDLGRAARQNRTWRAVLRIGDPGPMGRILIRGEAGHDIVPPLYPIKGEIVIDKPGKGAFYATCLAMCSKEHGIEIFWFAASPPKSASTPPCEKPMTAATAASCSRIAAHPTFPNSTRWACA